MATTTPDDLVSYGEDDSARGEEGAKALAAELGVDYVPPSRPVNEGRKATANDLRQFALVDTVVDPVAASASVPRPLSAVPRPLSAVHIPGGRPATEAEIQQFALFGNGQAILDRLVAAQNGELDVSLREFTPAPTRMDEISDLINRETGKGEIASKLGEMIEAEEAVDVADHRDDDASGAAPAAPADSGMFKILAIFASPEVVRDVARGRAGGSLTEAPAAVVAPKSPTVIAEEGGDDEERIYRELAALGNLGLTKDLDVAKLGQLRLLFQELVLLEAMSDARVSSIPCENAKSVVTAFHRAAQSLYDFAIAVMNHKNIPTAVPLEKKQLALLNSEDLFASINEALEALRTAIFFNDDDKASIQARVGLFVLCVSDLENHVSRLKLIKRALDARSRR